MLNPNSALRLETDEPLDAASPLNRALEQLAIRVEDFVREEQNILTSRPADFERLLARKELLAVDASRLSLAARGVALNPLVQKRLAQAAERLVENRHFLRRHIDAVSEIAALISRAVSRATSDGTYSRHAARRDRGL